MLYMPKTEERRTLVTLLSRFAMDIHTYNKRFLLQKCRVFLIHDGVFQGMSSIRRNKLMLIHDQDARLNIIRLMTEACRAKPPATAENFALYVFTTYKCKIALRTAQHWLNQLGFKYRETNGKSYYEDGQRRPDVVRALEDFEMKMDEVFKTTRQYYGEKMEQCLDPIVPVRSIADPTKTLFHAVHYHDESSAESKTTTNLQWRMKGATGMCQRKRGEPCMVAAFMGPDFGNYYRYFAKTL